MMEAGMIVYENMQASNFSSYDLARCVLRTGKIVVVGMRLVILTFRFAQRRIFLRFVLTSSCMAWKVLIAITDGMVYHYITEYELQNAPIAIMHKEEVGMLL